MSSDIDKIDLFLQKHHVLSLATSDFSELSVCNLFYIFNLEKLSFVVASGDETTHVRNIMKNSQVAGGVVLETKIIGKIQGVQFRGNFLVLEDDALRKSYFSRFPYAIAMSPKLWQIKIDYFKFTDNSLGFGKKIIWQESSL